MTPSALISAVTFLITVPTALIIRLLTLLNLNAVVLYYPSGLSSHESGPVTSIHNNSTLVSGSNDQTTDLLPLWLTHILQNHNISQSVPQWKGQEASVVVSIHLTVDFAQHPANHSFDQMVTIDMAKLELHNGIPQAVSPSNTTVHLHDKAGFHNHGDHEPHAVRHFLPAVVFNLFIYVLGLILICPAAWRQASHLGSSYRLLLHVVKNSRVAVPFRGHNEYAKDQKDPQVPSYGDIISEESGTRDCPPTHVESSIREWTPEDDCETDVTNITEPDIIALLLRDLVAGFGEPHLLGIAPDSSLCSEALSNLGFIPCDDSGCTFVDAGVTTCRPEREISLSYCKPDTCHPCPQSCHSSFGFHHSSLPAEDSELGTSRTLDFHSIGDAQRTFFEISESGYFTNTEFSLVYKQPDPPCHTQETSLTHIPRQPTPQRDPSTDTSRELVLYLRHPRAWEADDLMAAWRCFVRSRGGKRWVAYGMVGIAVLLQAVLVNFLASGL